MGDNLIVNLYNITDGATTTIVNHSSYISKSELTLTWDTRLDFNRIKLMTEQNNSFTVEKIEFMDDETPPEIIIQETWSDICSTTYLSLQHQPWAPEYIGTGSGPFNSIDVNGTHMLNFWVTNWYDTESITKVKVTFTGPANIGFDFCEGTLYSEIDDYYQSISSISGTYIASASSDTEYEISLVTQISGKLGIRFSGTSAFTISSIKIDAVVA